MGGVDLRVLEWAAQHRSPLLTSLTRGLMFLGTDPRSLLLLALLGLVLAAALRAWRAAVGVALALVLAATVANVLKPLVGRARPPLRLAIVDAYGYSMPSTEAARTAAVGAAVYLALRWAAPRTRLWAGPLTALVLVVVAASMVYLGAHWVSDILAGWALGLPIGALSAYLVSQRWVSRAGP